MDIGTWKSERLPRSFFLRPAVTVARDLLGHLFVHRLGPRILIGRIVETEAYRSDDPASHSFHGRTTRNEVMFRRGGFLYVYFTYGMHFCANVVTGPEGTGEAVLIRAVEPMVGLEIMAANRRKTTDRSSRLPMNRWLSDSMIQLTNGPAKFCQAFGIGKELNGIDLEGTRVFLVKGEGLPTRAVGRSGRIGIRVGTEHLWRFYLKGNPWVSRLR